MRVLQVIGSMDCGGAETFIMNLYRQIDKSEVQFDFVVHTSSDMYYQDEIYALGGKIYRAPRFTGINYRAYKAWWRAFFSKHPEYQVVHGHIGSSASIYLGIARKFGRYTIAHSHATHRRGISLERLEFALLTHSTRHIANYFMACSRQAGIDRYGQRVVNSNHFKVIKNGIDSRRYAFNSHIRQEVRAAQQITDDVLVIGHVGRFAPEKNHKKVLSVFKVFHQMYPNSVLWLFGTGPLEEKVKFEANDLGLHDAVYFKGLTSEVNRQMQAMDAFLFPSFYEGLGIALVEAQAAGLGCVVSNTIQDEADIKAQLIEKLDLNASDNTWSQALERAVCIPRKDTSHAVIAAGFDIATVARDLKDFYCSVGLQ